MNDKEYTPEEILLSIDPNYRRCARCNIFIHIAKNEWIHGRILGNYRHWRGVASCIFCGTDHEVIHSRVDTEIDAEIESIFGNLYDIVYDPRKGRYRATIKNKSSDQSSRVIDFLGII